LAHQTLRAKPENRPTCEFFSSLLGHVAYEQEAAPHLALPPGLAASPRRYSQETAREIDCAVRQEVNDAFARAKAILTENRPALEAAATRLLERETLAEDDLGAIARTLNRAA
jgi:cell division protease FtsH